MKTRNISNTGGTDVAILRYEASKEALKTMTVAAPARKERQPGVKTNADFTFVAIARQERHAATRIKLMGQSLMKKLRSSFVNTISTRKQLSTFGIYPKMRKGQ